MNGVFSESPTDQRGSHVALDQAGLITDRRDADSINLIHTRALDHAIPPSRNREIAEDRFVGDLKATNALCCRTSGQDCHDKLAITPVSGSGIGSSTDADKFGME